jgi:DNA-binding NarL/FixJ family response regulator
MNIPTAASAATPPVRLAIVDDHILFRKGLRALLSGYAGIEVVCEAGNGQELLELLELLDQGSRPNVILMDMQMPILDGLQTTRLLRTQFPDVRVVIISMHDDPSLVSTVLAEGAHSYLVKNTSPEEMRGAVLAAAAAGSR